MRLLLFIIIEFWLLPLQVVSVIAYLARVRWKTNPAGISGTANQIINARLAMHRAGTRPDEPTARLAPHLPVYGPLSAWLVGSFGLAARWSGYTLSWTEFPVRRPSSMNSIVGHRTEFFDGLLAEALDPKAAHRARQVVLLGAGWDTRAWGLLEQSDARIFEVDTPPTQSAKRVAIERAGLPSERVTFVETDFVDQTWLQAICEQGFDPTLPTFFLWEGVTMYLPVEAVEATLCEVAKLAPGSQIAFDFFSRELVTAQAPFERVGAKMQKGQRAFFANEPLRFGISTKQPARPHVEQLVASCGLTLAAYEPYGPEDYVFGGLAMAVRRASE